MYDSIWNRMKKISFIRENIDIKFKLKQTRNLHLNGNLRHIIGMLSSLLVFNWKDWFEKNQNVYGSAKVKAVHYITNSIINSVCNQFC